jgi:hypothetical protein|tara:strand:+ start:339 stop:539 length:201 start_codon:yes stop_codon:yes gene_type:complete
VVVEAVVENVMVIMELDKDNQVDLVVEVLVYLVLNLKMVLMVLQVEMVILPLLVLLKVFQVEMVQL